MTWQGGWGTLSLTTTRPEAAGIPIEWSDGTVTWQPHRNDRLEEALRKAVEVVAPRVPGDLVFPAGHVRSGWLSACARLFRSWRRRRARCEPF